MRSTRLFVCGRRAASGLGRYGELKVASSASAGLAPEAEAFW